MRKVGFVGLDKYKLLKCGVTEEQAYNFCRKLMINELKYGEYEFVSGGCKKKGIDTICERIADELGLKKTIIMSEVEEWDDAVEYINIPSENSLDAHDTEMIVKKGYKTRNIEIASIIDKLYCVVVRTKGQYCYHHRDKDVGNTHMVTGACYTMRVAKEKGKEVYLVFV